MALVPFSYNLRSLMVRRSATALTVLGIAATVAVLAGVLALQQGFTRLFTDNGRDDLLVRQIRNAWPNVFRTHRLVPAVEYLQANRLRTRLCRDFDRLMAEVDLVVHPSFAGGILGMTNLTGHPTIVAPNGFDDEGAPKSISFTGQLYGEERLVALVSAWQGATEHHRRHPDL